LRSQSNKYTDEQMNTIIDTVGTRPADLTAAISDGYEEFYSRLQARATNATNDLLILHPQYLPLLLTLLNKRSLSFREASQLINVSTAQMVSTAGAGVHVLSCDAERESVSLYSAAVANAVKVQQQEQQQQHLWW
jgi:hypothetical protein